MKKHFITALFLLTALLGYANNSNTANHIIAEEGLALDNTTDLLEDRTPGEIMGASISQATPLRDDFVNCTIKIKMEIDGVEIEGKLTIYDISLLDCALIKIGKFFSDLF